MTKRLVVCADGTWNAEDSASAPTNVAKLHRAIKACDVDCGADEQLVYYHNGVGTRAGQRLSGGMFGDGINENIKACYRFLVDQYEPGAELWFFGFSRGAYTVRSLAGLIRNSGIVDDRSLVDAAFDLYRSRRGADHPSKAAAKEFRKRHSGRTRAANANDDELVASPEIWFIGVWDTVGSLGFPVPESWRPLLRWLGCDYWFHDTALSRTVRHAYHALAIHERRIDFAPTLWQKNAGAPRDQVLEQRWFTGVHSDVGGGYGSAGLSDVALKWIAQAAMQRGLALRETALEPGPWHAPDPLGRCHDSSRGFFAAIDAVRGHPRGIPRVFSADKEYCAALAPSVGERDRRNKGRGHWPESFAAALKGELPGGRTPAALGAAGHPEVLREESE